MNTRLGMLFAMLSLGAMGCAYEMPSSAVSAEAADASVPVLSEGVDDVGASAEALQDDDNQNADCGGFVYYNREFRESCGFGGSTRLIRQRCQALRRSVTIRPGVIRCVTDYSTAVCATLYTGPCEPAIILTP